MGERREYDTPRWRKYRRWFLSQPENALCRECDRHGRVEPSTDVDHIEPVGGDDPRFYDTANHQGLCHSCHSAKTARENGGFGNASGRAVVGGCGVDGMPSDERHPWRQV